MSFWANRLGVQPQQPQAPAHPQPAHQAPAGPWWAVPQPAQQQSVQQTVTPQQQGSVTPAGEAHFGDLLSQDGYHTEKAQSAKDSELCPECDSPNYLAPKGHPNAMKQCFNCGYNPRFAHSTAGASGIGQSNVAAPKPARVQRLNQSNFNPGTIVGRVT